MKYLIALSFLAFASASNIPSTKDQECDIYPECPGGCCYGGFDWECCPGPEPALNCAPTLDDCPVVTKKIQLTQIAAPKQCDCCECPAGTDGPGGCCPNVGWECCPDGLWCAPTLDDCPVVTKKIQLTKMAAPKQCDDGFLCPGGCCPNVGWFCCPEWYCAPTAEDCW